MTFLNQNYIGIIKIPLHEMSKFVIYPKKMISSLIIFHYFSRKKYINEKNKSNFEILKYRNPDFSWIYPIRKLSTSKQDVYIKSIFIILGIIIVIIFLFYHNGHINKIFMFIYYF